MAPTFRTVAHNGVTNATLTVATTTDSTPQAGDTIIAVEYANWGSALTLATNPTSPSTQTAGWSTIGTTPTPTNAGVIMRAWRNVVAANGAQTVSVTRAGTANSGSHGVIIIVLPGAHATDPMDGGPTTTWGNSFSGGGTGTALAAVSPATDNALLIAVAAGSMANTSTMTWTPPTGMTERLDAPASAGSTFKNSAHVATQALTAAGSTGTRTLIPQTANVYAGMLFAIKGPSDITVDVPPVDVTVQTVTPTRQKVAKPSPVDTTRQVVAPETDKRANPAPVNVSWTVLPLDPAKVWDFPGTVDITSSPLAVDPLHVRQLGTPPEVTVQPVAPEVDKRRTIGVRDVTVEPVAPTTRIAPIVRPPVPGITVEVLPVDAGRIFDIEPVDTTVTAQGPLAHGHGIKAGPPVDIHLDLAEPVVSGQIAVPEVTVEVLPVRVQRGPTVAPVEITTVTVDPHQVKVFDDVTPVDVQIDPRAIRYGRGYKIPDLVDVGPIPYTPTLRKVVDVEPLDLLVEPVSADWAKAANAPVVPLGPVQFPRITVQKQDGRPKDVTVQPVTPKLGKIVDVLPVNITTSPVVVDPAKVSKPQPRNITVGPAQPTAYSASMDPPEIYVDVLPVTVAFGADKSAAYRAVTAWPRIHPARVLAQNILSREWVHLDLPISNLEVEYNLSAPQRISGVFPVEIRDLRDANLEPWGTWVHVEVENEIRASGILMPTEVDSGQQLSLEVMGVSGVPKGIPYQGTDFDMIQGDPADVVRHLWAHVQAYPDSNLGVVVRGITGYQLGNAVASTENVDFTTDTGEQVSFTATGDDGPYKLRWFESTDCGDEIGKLATEAPFDYVERQRWHNPLTKDYVEHFIDIGWPRAGRRRGDVSFTDANLMEPVGPGEVDGQYASQILVLGKGEGASKIRGYAGASLGTRIRRVKVIDDKTIDTFDRANAVAAEELARAQALLDITEFTAKARHQDAPLGSFDVGDDVPIDIDVPWLGRVRQWERVTSIAYSPDQEIMKIGCRRSETWSYGSNGS